MFIFISDGCQNCHYTLQALLTHDADEEVAKDEGAQEDPESHV